MGFSTPSTGKATTRKRVPRPPRLRASLRSSCRRPSSQYEVYLAFEDLVGPVELLAELLLRV